MEKKCKVVLLPTDEPSYLFIINKKKLSFTTIGGRVHKTNIYQPQHLYILSDDVIKEGDWYYEEFDGREIGLAGKDEVKEAHLYKKIIATTNLDLIKEGVLPINNKWLKEYCNNPVDEVLVEYYNPYEKLIGNKIGSNIGNFTLKESSFKLKISSDGTIVIKYTETWDTIEDKMFEVSAKARNNSYQYMLYWLKENYEVPKKK